MSKEKQGTLNNQSFGSKNILLGRREKTHTNIGNKRYLERCQESTASYVQAISKNQKAAIAEEVLNDLTQGGFKFINLKNEVLNHNNDPKDRQIVLEKIKRSFCDINKKVLKDSPKYNVEQVQFSHTDANPYLNFTQDGNQNFHAATFFDDHPLTQPIAAPVVHREGNVQDDFAPILLLRKSHLQDLNLEPDLQPDGNINFGADT